MKDTIKAKSISFVIHFALSFLVITSFILFIKFYWYQTVFFELEKVWDGIKILFLVDLVLGPLLTFIVYNKNKKSIKYDLTVIVVLQLLALIYGGSQIYQMRPTLLVFTGDRFELVVESDQLIRDLSKDGFEGNKNKDIPFLTYALPAQNDQESTNFIFNNTQYQKDAKRQKSIEKHIDIIGKHSLDIDFVIPQSKDAEKSLSNFLKENPDGNYYLLPVQGTYGDAIIVALSKIDGKVVDYIQIDPWQDR